MAASLFLWAKSINILSRRTNGGLIVIDLIAEDYEEMMTYFATEQEKEMTVEEEVINDTEETVEEV